MFRFTRYRIRVVGSILAGAMFLASTGAPQAMAVPATDAEKQQQVTAMLQRLSAISQRELAKPGADPSDVKQKAASFDNDPEKIFAFVRDQVRYEPYAGVLRGDRGTLLAMSGNAVDKSLLLSSMLDAGGVRTRLMSGQLPADKAAALVGQFTAAKITAGPIADAAGPAAPIDAAGQEFLATIAKETGLQADALSKAAASDAERAALVNNHAWAVADRETPELKKRLDTAGVKLGVPMDQRLTELSARATKHVWVEMQDPAGQWVALDPTIAGSQRGQSATAGQPYTVADADEHTVTLRLVYRHGAAGAPATDAELINVPMTTRHAASNFAQLVVNPADDLPPASKLMAMNKEQLIKTMAEIKRFQPALRVGGKSYFGKAFDLKGNLFEIPADGRLAGASKVGGATGGMFGGLAGGASGGSDKPDDGPGTFQELQVVIDIAAPGGKPQRQTRTLLTAKDVTGPVVKSPLINWDVLIQPGPIGGKWVSYQAVRTLVAATAPLLAVEKGTVGGKELDAMTSVRPEPCPTLLLTLALMRERAMARMLQVYSNVALLWDAPFVTFADRTFCMNPEAGSACGAAGIDIVDNSVSFVPREAGAESTAANAAMWLGVFDTAAEAAALRESLTSPGAPRPPKVYSAIDDFVEARKTGDALGVVKVETGKPPTEIALADLDRTWVAQNEPAGRVLVAPSKPADGVKPGWWTVDPASGTTLGRRSGGGGEAMSEKAILTNMIAFHVCMMSPIIDAAKGDVKDAKGGMKISIAMIGCIVGMVVGFGPGMTTALKAENLALMWTIFGAVLTGADKALG